MKNFTLISLLLLATLTLGCLNAPTQTTNSTTNEIDSINEVPNYTFYESSDFSINYPNNWKVDSSEYATTTEVTFAPAQLNENDTKGVIITVTKISPEARALNAPNLKQEDKTNEFVKLISNENVEFAGQVAFKTVFLITAKAANNTMQVDYVFTKGEKEYRVSYLYYKEDTNASAEIEEFLRTLKPR